MIVRNTGSRNGPWLAAALLVLTALILGACSSNNPAGDTPANQAEFSGPPMACNVVSLSPTQGPTEAAMFPPPGETDWTLGNPDAELTITEYSDFQCPYCAELASEIKTLHERNPETIRIVFRHFPLPSHPLSLKAAQAAEAAGLQGKFWEMHDRIFASQAVFVGQTDAQFEDWITVQAADLGLDTEKFAADMNSQAIIDKVAAARQHGLDVQISGTPFVLVNGQVYPGPRDAASFESILRMFQFEDRQYTECPPTVVEKEKQYTATLKTEKGDVILQLFPDEAPLAVNSFVYLARQGWFDNMTFYRVLPGFVAQSGDPSNTGLSGPGYTFARESNRLKFDKAGVVGMLPYGEDDNGSQFFITYEPVSDLDGKYTVFGQVTGGMEVLEALTPRDPSQQADLPAGDKILSVEIQEE